MKAKLIKEVLSSEDKWANDQIANWEKEKETIKPNYDFINQSYDNINWYINEIVEELFSDLPLHPRNNKPVSKTDIKKFITKKEVEPPFQMNVYDCWEADMTIEETSAELYPPLLVVLYGGNVEM